MAKRQCFLLPLRSDERVFDVALLLALDVIGPWLVKGPHEPQSCHSITRQEATFTTIVDAKTR